MKAGAEGWVTQAIAHWISLRQGLLQEHRLVLSLGLGEDPPTFYFWGPDRRGHVGYVGALGSIDTSVEWIEVGRILLFNRLDDFLLEAIEELGEQSPALDGWDGRASL